jgi:transaldolase
MTNPLLRLGELGQSPWFDNITHDLITSGKLARLIRDDGLRGMTSNPTIFEKAIAGTPVYDDLIRRLADEGRDGPGIFEGIAVEDVRLACDVFRPTYEATGGVDGTVSIEVSPTLGTDTAGTIAEAERLWHSVNRPNVMVKIPGTAEGLPAIEHCLTEGININITLLFAVERYAEVIEAFLRALEARAAKGEPIDRMCSVASFFVSRVDTKVDPQLDRIGDPKGIRGKTAIANAAMAYQLFERTVASDRWQKLAAKGARPQRPLWASTSTKDPKYPDIYYVEALIAPHTVDTMPPETFEAYRDHGKPEVRIHQAIAEAPAQLAALEASGISLRQVTQELEVEGVQKFGASFASLVKGVEAKVGELAGSR